jgi:bifunctional enzyme CysN/CysC
MQTDIDAFLNEHERKDLLRFITCGSVDDGKSTLIGRLLCDTKLIFDDQLSALQRDSEKTGNAGEGEIDYALLLDGLKAEREQGITIDVAYRYFATPKRKFIIADTPGHEQYTRNMATGASTADLAIILIDARQGLLTQTRRHSFIVSLLGIRHVIVAVNKMDLVDFSEATFNSIRQDYTSFTERLGFPDLRFIPLSALRGDNVVERSARLPWYTGPSLLEALEDVDVAADRNLTDFRFPVQLVSRPHLDFRGFAGTVVSGTVKVGDRVKALPSLRESAVRRIVTADGDLVEAFAPQAVTIELADEIDISSGEMIAHANSLPKSATHVEAMLIWMADAPSRKGASYVLRHTSRTTKARLVSLSYKVDINTLQKSPTEELGLNEIGLATLTTHQPLFFDPYARNRETGGFIVIDAVTNATVAAGLIVEHPASEPGSSRDEGDASSRTPLEQHVDRREFLWERGLVSPANRVARNQHRGQAIVITGSRGTGKRDLARHLELRLFKAGYYAYYLGVSNLIEGLDADVGDSFWDRDEHVRRTGELFRIMTDAGLIFISSLDDMDAYDLQKLRLLSSPNKLVIAAIGETALSPGDVDVRIPGGQDHAASVRAILEELNRLNVLAEYYI